MKKFYVIRTTKHGIEYKRTKCLDYWSKSPDGCWLYSRQGAKRIADRMNNQVSESKKHDVHYNILEVK